MDLSKHWPAMAVAAIAIIANVVYLTVFAQERKAETRVLTERIAAYEDRLDELDSHLKNLTNEVRDFKDGGGNRFTQAEGDILNDRQIRMERRFEEETERIRRGGIDLAEQKAQIRALWTNHDRLAREVSAHEDKGAHGSAEARLQAFDERIKDLEQRRQELKNGGFDFNLNRGQAQVAPDLTE